jgi:hypothetical protein
VTVPLTCAPDDPGDVLDGDGEIGDTARLDSLHPVDANKAMANAPSANRHLVMVMSLLPRSRRQSVAA